VVGASVRHTAVDVTEVRNALGAIRST